MTKAASGARGLPPLAVTMGDPAGIGIEIALRAWLARRDCALAPFVLFADIDAVKARSRHFQLDIPVVATDTAQIATELFDTGLPVRHVALSAPATPGEPDGANAGPVIAAIDQAVEAVRSGDASALVTCPIAKSVLYTAGFTHPGHTEYLGYLAERHDPGVRCHPVMMLVSDDLRVVPLTVHVPLAEVPGRITRQLIHDTLSEMADALRRDFGIAVPRIAVAGLNPHAGEDGTLGREDVEIIAPAIRDWRRTGVQVTGPHPADTMFHAKARASYDAALAMYHDQALIPLKILAFESGVNVTLGLPFVRTSPDHGTAFDIAARGAADPSSFVAALKLASAMAAARNHEISLGLKG